MKSSLLDTIDNDSQVAQIPTNPPDSGKIPPFPATKPLLEKLPVPEKIFAKIPPRAWALIIMCLWGGAILWLGVVRLDTFGLDEGAAMALLLNWSVSDQVANPVTTFGGPDLRALLFVPLGLYWSGSILAAKVFTLMITFGALYLLYRWQQRRATAQSDETALIATGLLLIAPVTLGLADSISTGPYLLLLFGLGWVLDGKYRASEHSISSLYFVQTLLVAITVTLHPMGLAYPLALIWRWQREPKSQQQKKQVWIGIAVAVAIVLAMRVGWIALPWLENPLTSLSYAMLGNKLADPALISPLPGIIPGALLLLVLLKNGRHLLNDQLGTTLLIALVLGLLVADANWALIALVVLFYAGVPLLIRANQALGRQAGFVGQRGLVMVCILVVATIFMQADRAQSVRIASALLSPQDELIQTLIPEAAAKDARFLAASQWPARTMLAVRADVLPLPPAAKDAQEQLAIIQGLTHVLFDHNDPENTHLARNFRELTNDVLTLTRQPGGVILKLRDTPTKPAHAAVPAELPKGDQPELPKP